MRKIPNFKTYKEEAAFWDKHSFTDYFDNSKIRKVKLSKTPKLTFSVRLDKITINKLDSIAKQKGIGPRTLARMWLIEKLKTEDYQFQSA